MQKHDTIYIPLNELSTLEREKIMTQRNYLLIKNTDFCFSIKLLLKRLTGPKVLPFKKIFHQGRLLLFPSHPSSFHYASHMYF